ncbi:hypothetical protein FRZ67_01605 [Panacibacter ginsenosidivorans]|uniref:Uncharacterized protein n=1 Tax=Panacibacter ginsenosidivorans TaxID=1813871 RepID=A0A5B8V5H8_9BACT|nr:hypothetical protein [Panacibacter ginsenosidivorans]QEC66063.1 hypothetical protein FRZ67_01605 [Panacibacter ginsenosidivorans]
MKQLFTLLLILLYVQVHAQDSLKNFNYSRNHITLTGMKVLGSWGIVNLGVGAAGWAGNDGGSDKYFHQMNTLWGAANAGIAVLGLTGAKRNLSKQPGVAENIQAQQSIEKTFLINGGLDFVYIGSGIFLNARGNSHNNAQLKGYGSSVIMQGVFLLLFDATMYSAQRTNGNKFRGFLEKSTVIFSGNKIGIVYNL